MRVGSEDRWAVWHLPKALLTHCSPFFAAALEGSFFEAESRTVSLPDDNPEVFETFVQWLYIGEIRCTVELFDSYERWTSLIVASWMLGDKLGCQAFQDAAMTQLLAYHNKGDAIQISAVRAAYEGSPPGSKLRKWAVDQFLYEIKLEGYGEPGEKESWVSQVEAIENFGQDFLEASLDLGGSEMAEPYMNGQRYMEVSTYKHEMGCRCRDCVWR